LNKYKVLISLQAYEELEAIYKYIALSLLSSGAANYARGYQKRYS